MTLYSVKKCLMDTIRNLGAPAVNPPTARPPTLPLAMGRSARAARGALAPRAGERLMAGNPGDDFDVDVRAGKGDV